MSASRSVAVAPGLLALGPLALASLPGCFPFMDDIRGSRADLVASAPHLVRSISYRDGSLTYVRTGDSSGPTVVFVHGSPGAWDGWSTLLHRPELSQRYDLIAYDRPGFGQTRPGQVEPSLHEQAAAIALLLNTLNVEGPVFLVGHSLGGPVIARFAMDYPQQTRGLVFLAASVDPGLERRTWYQKAADWRIAQHIVPDELLVANREIAPLKGELELMMPLWPNISAPAVVVQGQDDKLVPPANADFLMAHLDPSRTREVLLPGVDHLLPWRVPEQVDAALSWLQAQ